MFSLSVLVLTLLVSAVQAFSSSGGCVQLSGQALTDLYNSRVYTAELMRRPKSSSSSAIGPFSHSGVRVTVRDGGRRQQWLIHKGQNYGDSSDTVVVSADCMSSKWELRETKDFRGTRTVAEFVDAGGSDYSLLFDNCHHAADRMMNQNLRSSK